MERTRFGFWYPLPMVKTWGSLSQQEREVIYQSVGRDRGVLDGIRAALSELRYGIEQGRTAEEIEQHLTRALAGREREEALNEAWRSIQELETL